MRIVIEVVVARVLKQCRAGFETEFGSPSGKQEARLKKNEKSENRARVRDRPENVWSKGSELQKARARSEVAKSRAGPIRESKP